jgi:hypothetical protein
VYNKDGFLNMEIELISFSPYYRVNDEELCFRLSQDLPEESASMEIIFYCNLEGNEIFINGKKATVFRLGDRIEILSKKNKLELKFSLLEGEGSFCGHLSQGNRPFAQSAPFTAKDWKISLRTLSRSAHCLIGTRMQNRTLEEG